MNTATIDLKEYNELRDYRTSVLNNGCIIIPLYKGYTTFYTNSNEVKKMIKELNNDYSIEKKITDIEISQLKIEITDLKKQNRILNNINSVLVLLIILVCCTSLYFLNN